MTKTKSNSSNSVPVTVLRLGEGLPGGAPSWVWQVDFTLPLHQRADRNEFVQAVSTVAKKKRVFGDRILDMHGYLSDYMKEHRSKMAFTYNDLINLVIRPNSAFSNDLDEILALLEKVAPYELDFDFNATVENTGAGQIKGRGAVVALAFLAADGAQPLLDVFEREGTQMVVLTYGANGSTGVGFALAAKKWLNRVGITTVFKISLMAHQPSLAVSRVVRESTVRSVFETGVMLPGSVLAVGVPLLDDNGVSLFWTHLLNMLSDLSANASNAPKKAKDVIHGNPIPLPYSSNILMLMLSYRKDLAFRYLAYLLANAAAISEEDAVATIKKYVEKRWLDFGAPDLDGFSSVDVRNYRSLELRYMQELLPALAYVTHNEVTVSGTRLSRWLKRPQPFEIKLRGSNIVNQILEAAGVTNLAQLQNGSGSHASFIGLTEYEHRALENATDYTIADIEDYFLVPGNWYQEAFNLAAPAFKGYTHFEPAVFAPGNDEYYTWTQLGDSEMGTVVRALGMMGRVEDPRELDAIRAETAAIQANVQDRVVAGKKGSTSVAKDTRPVKAKKK